MEEDPVDESPGAGQPRDKRRIDVVHVFLNDDALLPLVTAVLFEMHDEWIASPAVTSPKAA
ncbi:transposase [Streptomyces sp. NPDC026673]|uniref:transposase n=1 Tax=Streptomyces sp. NPDC026673 TaxID=3155724 RepID=UPI0033E3C88B